MSEEDVPYDPDNLIKMYSDISKISESNMSPDQIKELEEELIKLEEEHGEQIITKIQNNQEEIFESKDENQESLIKLNEKLLNEDYEKIEEIHAKYEEFENNKPENSNIKSEFEQIEVQDDFEANILKKYQTTLQELKEEISKLNKQIEYRDKIVSSEPSEEEVFKLRHLCKYAKAESRVLKDQTQQLIQANYLLSDKIQNLKAEPYAEPISNEKVENLKEKLRLLKIEYEELLKPSEINIADLERVISPDATPKLLNEFYVNVQKRIGVLDEENSKYSSMIKKSSTDLLKLKEKVENAANRRKINEDLKTKQKTYEETLANYLSTEYKLMENLKQAKEEYSLYSSRPENQHNTNSAKNVLKEMREQANKEESEVERLEFVLQEKKNLLRASQVYGLQKSKTASKLRTDMELLGLVLVEKEQTVSRLRKEIDEFKIKANQISIDIKEINDKRNSAY